MKLSLHQSINFHVWLMVLSFGLASGATPNEQADSFIKSGLAAMQRDELQAAENCYILALRADPDSQAARKEIKRLSEVYIVKGTAAEGRGDLAGAKTLFYQALHLNPDDPVARNKWQEIEKKLPSKSPGEKIKEIIIPRIDFEDTSIEEAIDFLRLRARELDVLELDPARKGVDIVIPKASGGDDMRKLRIRELRIRNVPLNVALKYICDQTKLSYRIVDDSVILADPLAMIVRRYRVPPDFVARLENALGKKGPFADKSALQVRWMFEQFGLSFPNEGSVAWGDKGELELVLESDAKHLDMAEQLLPHFGVAVSSVAPTVSTKQPGPNIATGLPIQGAATGLPKWTNKTGKTIVGDFVGLDGPAVVVRREGKEVTIPFATLSPESLNQAKRFGVPPPGVLLYYNFSDTSGEKLLDRSGNGRDGTLVGFSDTSAGAGDSVGSSGWTKSGSLNFDGADDYVSTPLSASMIADGDFTIEAVVTHNNANATWGPVIGSDTPTVKSPGVVQFGKVNSRQDTSPATAFVVRLNGLAKETFLSTRPTSIADGGFHHVALVRSKESGLLKIYFDHQLFETVSGMTGVLNGNPNLLVGANAWASTERWFGLISELRITKSALNPAQFLPNPNPSSIIPPVPVHRYSFSGDVKDSIGTAHGTLVDAGQPTARFTEGRLDISANKGERGGSPAEDAYAEFPSGVIAGMNGKATFELWCRPTDWRLNSYIFGFFAKGATIAFNYRNRSNDLMSFLSDGSTGGSAGSGLDLHPGAERHFVLVLDPADSSAGEEGTLTLYLDGYKLGTGEMPANFAGSFGESKNWLGNRDSGGPTFSGIYNEFRIYDKALSPQEVLASYLAGPDATYPSAGSGGGGKK